MLTYELKKKPGMPLYEALYRCIREDILAGVLTPGEKLPSKRALAQNLEVSKITVETAYSQLLSEGYIRSSQRQGYFVEALERPAPAPAVFRLPREEKSSCRLDLTGGGVGQFPFSVWTKLQREVILDYGESLLEPLPNRGVPELRRAIAQHLAQFRGMQVDPENILIGAGTDFLYNLLIQLLGRELTYAVEEPSYPKIRQIYRSSGAATISASMDGRGVLPEVLDKADILHLSPSHHFPTGLITPMSRRQELLERCRSFIIEDDYDSEFRFNAHPMSAMQTMHPGKVIYMNTFSKTLAPSIRISYMVLPDKLMESFQRKLGFYSCTVPSFEQYTLAKFLTGGAFEKHINRMRKFYRAQRNALLTALGECAFAGKITILEQDAGLHFLVQADTALSDRELTQLCARAGLRIQALGDFYHDSREDRHTLIVNYSGLGREDFAAALEALEEEVKNASL